MSYLKPDRINSIFEVVGGVFVLLNVLQVLKDRQVHGVSITAVGFFTVWGFWNLIYYRKLGQCWSWWGSASVTIVNTIWLSLLIYWR